jgi:hypothetical protein
VHCSRRAAARGASQSRSLLSLLLEAPPRRGAHRSRRAAARSRKRERVWRSTASTNGAACHGRSASAALARAACAAAASSAACSSARSASGGPAGVVRPGERGSKASRSGHELTM